jgi:hypothetical protein
MPRSLFLNDLPRRALAGAAALACVLALSGCVTVQMFPTSNSRAITLAAGDLESHGIAFITPSTATGREEEKQAVAHLFAEAMKRERPGVKVVSLPETLSAINHADQAEAYKRMYGDHRDTGLFQRGMLEQVGQLTGAHYIAQIKLQEFREGAKERFGALGFRIVETRFAHVRLFFQIWDSRSGAIAWEGMEEMLYSHERINEEPVTFQKAIDRAAQHLIARLPNGNGSAAQDVAAGSAVAATGHRQR